MSRKDSLRGCVITRWKASGSHEFMQYDQVLAWAKDCDNDFSRRGLNPAPKFRNDLQSGHTRDVKTYLRGERFPFRIVNDLSRSTGIEQLVSSQIRDSSKGRYTVSMVISLVTCEKREHIFELPNEQGKAREVINNIANAASRMLSDENSVFILPKPWGFYKTKEIVYVELVFRTPADWEDIMKEYSKPAVGFRPMNP